MRNKCALFSSMSEEIGLNVARWSEQLSDLGTSQIAMVANQDCINTDVQGE